MSIVLSIIMYTIVAFSCLFSSLYAERVPSINVVIRDDFRGEHECAARLKIACDNLGWKIKISDIHHPNNSTFDWTLTLVPKNNSKPANDFLAIFDPEHHYFYGNGHLKKEFSSYAGYLTTYPNTERLLQDIRGKSLLYPKRWYPTVQYTPYKEIKPERLFYFFGHWGERLESSRYQTMQRELAKKPYTNLYGAPALGSSYGNAFRGSIPFDGVSTIKIISDLGVCLVLHSETHRKYGLPSGRLFEAAAASAVIISDLNQFVIENFGDAVLYIDEKLSGESIAQQIDQHMIWIKNHQSEAKAKAKRAHQIFEEKFLLEYQLLDFEHFLSEQTKR